MTMAAGDELARMETVIAESNQEVNQNFSLSKEETFSFDPVYKQKDLDVVWKKNNV